MNCIKQVIIFLIWVFICYSSVAIKGEPGSKKAMFT